MQPSVSEHTKRAVNTRDINDPTAIHLNALIDFNVTSNGRFLQEDSRE